MQGTKKVLAMLLTLALTASLSVAVAGCGTAVTGNAESTGAAQEAEESTAEETGNAGSAQSAETPQVSAADMAYSYAENGMINGAEEFSDRDLTQEADLTEAVSYTISDGDLIQITEAGVYVISGTAEDAAVLVDAGDDDKVQIVLDGVTVTNQSIPAIYVRNADKVFVTTTDSENTLSVTGTFTTDGDTNTDAVIFSKDDLVLNGTGTLTISSTDNGITSKDDLKVTGGTLVIDCVSDALEANDSIRIAGGSITVSTKKDGLHAENDSDDTLGYIYICGGTLQITAGDDAIHGTSVVQIDGGTINASGAECIEGTYIQINDGTINIEASDDGINGARKSSAYTPTVEINGGTIVIVMGSGDTDGIDSNGKLIINGGTVDITAQSPFDYDGTGELNGGTLIVNGSETTSLSNQFGGGFGGGHGNNFGGFGNGSGSGYGNGYGRGYGNSFGSDYGNGYGNGTGSDYGNGFGESYGNGSGNGFI